MIPTGLKLYFGIAAAAITAAVIGGYTSGGDGVGPISAGYKGGVGDQVSYSILLGVALVAIIIGSMLTYFRDVDAEAVADSMGRVVAPIGQRPVAASIWPIIAGVGAGMLVTGLAVSPLLFGVGLVVLGIVAFEWTMTAWADRATGDSRANEALRDQVMGPFEVPLFGLLGGGVFVLAVSRIFLAAGATGAVIAGSVVAVIVLAAAALITQRPNLSKNVVTALVGLVAFGVLGGGVWGAIAGEASHGEEHGDETGVHTEDGTETDEPTEDGATTGEEG